MKFWYFYQSNYEKKIYQFDIVCNIVGIVYLILMFSFYLDFQSSAPYTVCALYMRHKILRKKNYKNKKEQFNLLQFKHTIIIIKHV